MKTKQFMHFAKAKYKVVFILSLLTMVSFQSCEKYLAVKPTNVVALNNYEDVKAFMGSYLKGFSSKVNYLRGTTNPLKHFQIKMFNQFYADDLDYSRYLGNNIGRNNKGFFNKCLNWVEYTIPGTVWKEYYLNIGYFNTALTELNKISSITNLEYEIVAGETKVLRAWYLFKLTQYFVPYHDATLGLPINLDADKVGTFDSNRKTQAETFAVIINELNEVLSYTTAPKENYNIFYDKEIVHALLAQVYLYKGGGASGEAKDYEMAISHAQAAMKNKALSGLNNYNPMGVEKDHSGVYKNHADKLLMFTYSDYSDGLVRIIGIPEFGMLQYASADLYAMYSDKDIRKRYFFDANMAIKKFEHPSSSNKDIHALWTMSEMQLIIAESYARLKKTAEAQEAYTYFMTHRVQDYQYQGGDLLQLILDERRKEFCFEDDMRWMDLTRLQKGWSRKALDLNAEHTYTLKDNDYRFCLPIPLNEELEYNKIFQNPGWGNIGN